MKRVIKKIFPFLFSKPQKNNGENDGRELFQNVSYSQEGEDLILNRIFGDKSAGCYVDVGAHHPQRFSNTYIFYLKGWKGINIDPLPGTKDIFDRIRSRDTTLEMGVSQKEQSLTYFMFNEPALNTFDPEEAKLKNGIHDGQFFITQEKEIKTFPLDFILDKHLSGDKQIDFMTIDVEGLDMEVLVSNNWDKYRPNFILIEELRTSIEEIFATGKVNHFLKSKGYSLMHRTVNTSFYKNDR